MQKINEDTAVESKTEDVIYSLKESKEIRKQIEKQLAYINDIIIKLEEAGCKEKEK